MIRLFCFIALFIGVAFASLPLSYVQADETPENLETSPDKIEDIQKAAQDAIQAREKAYDMMQELTQNVKPHEKQHFRMLYTSYNLIQTVKVVRTDVSDAITQCGENNPDMKAPLDERFKEWDDAVHPLLEEADGNLNNMIIAQEYAPEKNIRDILRALDRSREKAGEQIKKIPVTTPEACTFLKEKMGDTQAHMVGLLRSTLVSFPKAFHESDWDKPEDSNSVAEENTEGKDNPQAPAEDEAEQ